MRTLADGVHRLEGTPRNAINVYLVGDVLVDAGSAAAKKRILRQLDGRQVSAHVVTHAHADRFGSSRAVGATLAIPLWRARPMATTSSRRRRSSPTGPISRALMKSRPPHARPAA